MTGSKRGVGAELAVHIDDVLQQRAVPDDQRQRLAVDIDVQAIRLHTQLQILDVAGLELGEHIR